MPYIVQFSRWGEFLSLERGCDPAVAACRDAPPRTLARELRHLIPLLPVWWPPRGFEWEDTVAFGDDPRPHGWQGTVQTTYRTLRDTVVGTGTFWKVTWHATWPPVAGAVAGRPLEESGTVLVDKERRLPAWAEWTGTFAAPGIPGATRMEIRGRAVLVGSVFDSTSFTETAK
jgi:hypothetical protein